MFITIPDWIFNGKKYKRSQVSLLAISNVPDGSMRGSTSQIKYHHLLPRMFLATPSVA